MHSVKPTKTNFILKRHLEDVLESCLCIIDSYVKTFWKFACVFNLTLIGNTNKNISLIKIINGKTSLKKSGKNSSVNRRSFLQFCIRGTFFAPNRLFNCPVQQIVGDE